MKALIALLALVTGAAVAGVTVKNEVLGSGTPGQSGEALVTPVDIGNGIYHAEQYMPGYPTAGVIWARVIDIPCIKVPGGLKCDGYTWKPAFGRAEYLFVKPVLVQSPEPVIKEVPVIILKEVPAKRKKE